MVAPHLPQEIVEEIIDLLAGDKGSLLSCSLVSTGWVDRSRYHLLANLKLRSLSDLQFWSGTGLGRFSHHVRSLDLVQNDELKWIVPDALAQVLNDFTSFYNVQSLALIDLDLTLFDQHSLPRYFGHLSERLTSLSVKRSTVNPDTLLFFICMFPGLDDLELDNLSMGKTPISSPCPAVTPRFRGKLTLLNIKSNGTSAAAPFIDPPLPMAFRDVCVKNCRFDTPKSLRDLFVACQETVKTVKVARIYLDDTSQTPLIDLSPFRGLEEVGLSLVHLSHPNHWIEAILRTVTSNRLRKIIFDTDSPTVASDVDSSIDLRRWSRLDEIFLMMANLLDGTGEKLEVVFNALAPVVPGEFKPVDPGRFLERCRTKATVTFGYI